MGLGYLIIVSTPASTCDFLLQALNMYAIGEMVWRCVLVQTEIAALSSHLRNV